MLKDLLVQGFGICTGVAQSNETVLDMVHFVLVRNSRSPNTACGRRAEATRAGGLEKLVVCGDSRATCGLIDDHVLRRILDFAEGEGSEEAHAVLRVWRALSTRDRQLSDATARLPSVAEHVVMAVYRP